MHNLVGLLFVLSDTTPGSFMAWFLNTGILTFILACCFSSCETVSLKFASFFLFSNLNSEWLVGFLCFTF